MEEKIVFNTEDVNENKVFGILSYIGILVLIPIFAAKDSQYARFHANQGLVLCIAEIAVGIVCKLISFILSFVPGGFILAGLLDLAVAVFSLVFMIIGIVNACSGEAKQLPIIGGVTILK